MHAHKHARLVVSMQEEDQMRKGLREPKEMVTLALRQSFTKQGVWEVRVCVWSMMIFKRRAV